MNDTTSPPQTLWHYTNADGLFGIVKSSRLRFGEARFLNDRTERTYGPALIDQILEEERLADDSDGAVSSVGGVLYVSRLPDRLHLCSFSENEESIGLWQRYGGDGNGYCIGFDPRRLDDALDHVGVTRTRMIYNEADQRAFLRQQVRNAVAEYREAKAKGGGSGPSTIEAIMIVGHIDWVAFALKNPFFHDEEEWRYFLTLDNEEDPELDSGDDPDNYIREDFDVRAPYIKPFVLLPAQQHGTRAKLPITSVICGPRLNFELAEPSVNRFLRSHGYADVRVGQSRLAQIWR
ncbi:MAG: DUF2971 domain-containing protein [Thermoanaerobaculia bacterium]|jgi:hypothetical protein